MANKRGKTMSGENQNAMFVSCRLQFTALPDYGHIIHIVDGVRYELHVDQSTEVDRAHLEQLKKVEPHLFVED